MGSSVGTWANLSGRWPSSGLSPLSLPCAAPPAPWQHGASPSRTAARPSPHPLRPLLWVNPSCLCPPSLPRDYPSSACHVEWWLSFSDLSSPLDCELHDPSPRICVCFYLWILLSGTCLSSFCVCQHSPGSVVHTQGEESPEWEEPRAPSSAAPVLETPVNVQQGL